MVNIKYGRILASFQWASYAGAAGSRSALVNMTWHHDMCQCCQIPNSNSYHSVVRLYRSTSRQSESLKPTTRFILYSLTIKETNFVLILLVQFSEVAAATTNMTDLSRHEYDWRLWLSHINMTDSDLIKYDWRRRLGDGGSGDYARLRTKFGERAFSHWSVCMEQTTRRHSCGTWFH